MPLARRRALFPAAPSLATPTPPPSPPQYVLPASYRVAIFLDASILVLTLVILVGAVLYIQRRSRGAAAGAHRGRRRHARDAEEGATLLHAASGPAGLRRLAEKAEKGDMGARSIIVVRELRPGRATDKGKKKGHVRWAPSVQGGEPFGIEVVVPVRAVKAAPAVEGRGASASHPQLGRVSLGPRLGMGLELELGLDEEQRRPEAEVMKK